VAVYALIEQAEQYQPKIIKFPNTGEEPLRERARLESAADG